MKAKEILLKLRDFVEIYLPCGAFIVMFLVFVAQVISRYVFNFPLTWAYEVTVWGFAWTVILGACYAMRARSHVTFTMIYDALPPKVGALFCIIGNILIVAAFAILIVPSCNYIKFMFFQKTSVFRIPLTVIFAPFAYFLCSIIGYTITDIISEVKVLKNPALPLQDSETSVPSSEEEVRS
ncbi:MAG: TRAP transporter small permease [Treponema sp.]|nr:TRAP transporter small permease [Treponema sp.]